MNSNLDEIIKKDEYLVENETLNAVFYKDLYGRYIYCNREFCKCLGLVPNQIIGKNDKEIYELIKPFNILEIKDNEVISCKKKLVYQRDICLDNNKIINLEITKTPMVDSQNKVCGIVGVVREIGSQKSVDEEIEKLRTDFFSNLSHELGTPINTIMSSLQLLSYNIDSMESVDIEKIKYINDIIRKNGLRLLKLTNNLVYVTKLDANEVTCNLTKNDIVGFIERICMKASEFCKSKGIDLVFDTNEEEYIGKFDSNIIEKILLNLISNAIKYNKKNGRIEVLLICEYQSITIKVKDYGVGIPNRDTKRIFDKLSYVDDRLVKLNEGSGLGLYITSTLVKIYGGSISVDSSLGEGSEFTVKLPFEKINESSNLDFRQICSGFDPMSVEFSDIY